MKKAIPALIIVSLALNLALLALLLAGHAQTNRGAAAPAEVRTPVARSKSPVDAGTWDTLNTTDLAAMVQRLRERGFPVEVIRAIIAAQLRELYAARERALDPTANGGSFWKNYSIDPKIQAARMQLYREQQKALRTLLGADAEPRDNINALYQGRRFDSVPADKVDAVQGVLRDFEDARQDLYSSAGGTIGPELQKRIAALEKDQHDALARVLSPQELEEWDVRNSDSARSLRYQLSAFDPTEQEFRALYKLQAEFDERFGRLYVNPGPEELQRRGEAQRQMNDQIKAMLGPVRGAEYERANDYNYRQTSLLVARLEMPPETTNQIYAVQKDIQDRLRDTYRAGPDAVANRQSLLAALEQEAQARITSLLGTRGFEAYKQYGGIWMQSLRPRPPPAVPAAAPGK